MRGVSDEGSGVTMNMHRGSDREDRIIESMRAAKGFKMYDEYEWATRQDPDFMEGMAAFSNGYWSPSYKRALEPKFQELIAIAILCYRGFDLSLKAHMKRAMRLGATRQEILETLEAGVLPGGGPVMHLGLRALMELEAEGALDGQGLGT
jgi:alkylhydroperoxidase/carboxymuconolactone decarboxylase family protein YurZ